MTATNTEESQTAASIGDCAVFLQEIAAQLAELNAKLAKVTEEGGHLDWIGAAIGNIADKPRDPR